MDWIEAFPSLRDLSEDTRCRLLAGCSIIELSEGSRIFGPGQAPENFLLLLDGLIRVQQVAANGREIVLYRVAAGETCALTTACLLGYEEYHAEAIAETDIRAAVIRRGSFDELIASSSEFRRFVFTTFSLRVTSIFRLIEEVIFSRVDVRLAQLLAKSSSASIHATHQSLANELGSAREVISRLLNEFQRRNWVRLSRGSIEITDLSALKALAGEAGHAKTTVTISHTDPRMTL
jgi:CRP/FNR family transcriptional regulator, anaerobic regulatory protein